MLPPTETVPKKLEVNEGSPEVGATTAEAKPTRKSQQIRRPAIEIVILALVAHQERDVSRHGNSAVQKGRHLLLPKGGLHRIGNVWNQGK